MKTYLIPILLGVNCLLAGSSYAQLVNNGDAISLSSGSLLFVGDSVTNIQGYIENKGTIEVRGHFVNNDPNSLVFTKTSTGVVSLSGDDQEISGSRISFPGLALSGTGVKILKTDIDVDGVLSLGDKHLKADIYTIHVTNPNPDALIRGETAGAVGTGFISTEGKGALIRNTNIDKEYLFPLGSDRLNSALVGVSTLYRPVTFKPENSLNSFSATLINSDPTADGFDKDKKRYDVKSVSDKYYYLLGKNDDASKVDVTFYQNSNIDNSNTQLVTWNSYLQWEKAAPSSVTSSSAAGDDLNGGTLNTTIKFSSIQPLHNTPFTFSSEPGGVNPFTFFNAFSPDGDGRNDTWEINNIEIYPDNKLTIYNRWGDEVFSATGYTNAKAWDGGNLQPGTYYYVLTTTIENQARTFKGFITMIKKN